MTTGEIGINLSNGLEYILDARQRIIRQIDLPEKWPALNSIVTDDENNLWVSTIPDNDSLHEWLVINDTGNLIATFRWHRNRSIEKIKAGYLYTRETDEETGQQQVVRYRVEME